MKKSTKTSSKTSLDSNSLTIGIVAVIVIVASGVFLASKMSIFKSRPLDINQVKTGNYTPRPKPSVAPNIVTVTGTVKMKISENKSSGSRYEFLLKLDNGSTYLLAAGENTQMGTYSLFSYNNQHVSVTGNLAAASGTEETRTVGGTTVRTTTKSNPPKLTITTITLVPVTP